MIRVVLASHNPGKLAEVRAIAEPYGVDVVGAGELGLEPVPETGETYEENARCKARSVGGDWIGIGEDSGLEVRALGGRPGLLSARYGGDISQGERNRMLLEELRGQADRTARFVAVCVVSFPAGRETAFRGECRGEISDRPRGAGGFGYDPLFIPTGDDRTLAEMSPEEKNSRSHRRQALVQALDSIVGAGGS